MEIKLRLKRHESFSIREGWLAKGIRAVKENEKAFSGSEATNILGIGTNMVKSLRYWLSATQLISEEGKSIKLSEFGDLIDQYDPYLEDNFTWWLIYLKLILNLNDSYIYNLFFNKCLLKSFSKRDVYNILSSELDKLKIEYNENTLMDEVSMIIKTFSIDEKIDNPENNYICPLSDLNLIKKIDKDNYERIKPDAKNINYLLVYYLLLQILDDKDYISIEDLFKIENSPSKLFNLDKSLVNEFLDEMKKNDLIIINRTAGLNIIYINRRLSLSEIMNEYYG